MIRAAGTFLVLTWTAATGAMASSAAAAQPESGLDLESLFRRTAHGSSIHAATWTADGRRLGYLFEGADGTSLMVFEATSRRSVEIVGVEELEAAIGDEPAKLTSLDLRWSPAADSLLITSPDDLWLWSDGRDGLRRLTRTAAEEEDPKFAPDGSAIAFTRDADLWLLRLDDGAERRLTTDGEPGVTLNGTTDWVYWEEIWSRHGTGFWWAPDARRIAHYRFDETAVPRYPLSDLLEPYPQLEWQRYPVAGETNPTVRVGVLDVRGGDTTWLDTGSGPDVYLARVDWTPAGDALMVQRLNRDQTRLDLLRCDPGSGACREILTESWPTWVNLDDGYRFLEDGRFVWPSERSGWRQLYLYSADGEPIRQITRAEGAVTSLDAVDEQSSRVLYTAYGGPPLGAADRQVWSAPLAGGEPTLVAGEPGWNTVEAAADGAALWLHSWSDADHPPRLVVRNANGELVAALPAQGVEYDPAALPRWTFLTLRDAQGRGLPAALLRPRDFDPGTAYPVLMYHYGGPASQVVSNAWSRPRGLWHKLMATRGFVVLAVDNPASIYFGKRGEDLQHRRFGEINLAAQLAAAAWLRRQPWVDPERIGLWGWSGGGTNTLYVMTHSHGVWRAGMAGAPVTDWHYYDTIWTERYLDHPATNEGGYRESSPLSAAAKLSGQLLIVHGTADDNVHPANTFAFVEALVEAGRPFEMAIYPTQDHSFEDASEEHFYRRMTEFFERVLAGE